jgi:hypothetical protein
MGWNMLPLCSMCERGAEEITLYVVARGDRRFVRCLDCAGVSLVLCELADYSEESDVIARPVTLPPGQRVVHHYCAERVANGVAREVAVVEIELILLEGEVALGWCDVCGTEFRSMVRQSGA